MPEINEWQFYFDRFAPEYDKVKVEHVWGGTYGRNPIDLDGYVINMHSRKITEVI